MEKPLVTIYTQAYNSEAYIAECIESVLKQTYTNFEYFVCNHGSLDNTLRIIEEYAALDSRIKVINMPNEARGFYPDMIAREGKGKYFAMLDSDDYWAEDNLDKLVTFAEKYSLDMAVCGIYSFNDNSKEVKVLRQVPEMIYYDICNNSLVFNAIFDFLRTTWGKVIRMDILRQADFSVYKENAKHFISDDTAFTLANYAKCKRIGAIPDLLLYYRFSDHSVTVKYSPKLIDNNVNIYYLMESVLEEIGDDSEQSWNTCVSVFWGAVYMACKKLYNSALSYSERLDETVRLLNTEIMQGLLQDITGYEGIVEYILHCVVEATQRQSEFSEKDIENLKVINLLTKNG